MYSVQLQPDKSRDILGRQYPYEIRKYSRSAQNSPSGLCSFSCQDILISDTRCKKTLQNYESWTRRPAGLPPFEINNGEVQLGIGNLLHTIFAYCINDVLG